MILSGTIRALCCGAFLLCAVGPGAGSALAAGTDACRPITQADAAKLKGRAAVLTDLDGVVAQYVMQDYGPTNNIFLDLGVGYPRQDAALMMNIYHRRGYAILYMAGRPRQMKVLGKSMCQASIDWLQANGFPTEEGDAVVLLRDMPDSVIKANNRGVAMAEWMSMHGTDLFATMVGAVKDRYGVKPAYAYVDSDGAVDAYLKVGVPAGNIFSIGNKGISRFGYKGTHAIVGPQANPGYAEHVKNFVIPKVPRTK